MDKLTLNNTLEKGDSFTIASQYECRTFWQWIRNKPKKLKKFIVTHTYESLS